MNSLSFANRNRWTSYSYNKGWRTSASGGNSAYAYNTFDGLGRATAATQTTSGTPYPFTYSYNLIDAITSMTMPSGTVVTTGYDNLGRPNTLSGRSGSTTTPYVTSVGYAPHGAQQQVALGNGLTEQTCYNSMLQPFVIRQRRTGATSCQTGAAADGNDVGYFSYTFPTGNNGNVASQSIQYGASGPYGSKTFQQNYGYDGVNRLSYVTESGSAPWSQTFGYDLVGNRWLSGGAQIDPSTPITDVYTANNQINSTGYDAKGNQTTSGGYVFAYDAENRLVTTNMYGTAYGYNADGRRVTKATNGVTTTYVYDVTGQLAAQYASSGSAPCPLTCYLMTDYLGSTRMQTDSGGNQLTLYDYAPFGEELAGYGGRDARWGGFGSGIHFAGKEQEGFEGAYMHYFGARYFSGGLGRFTGADQPFNDQYPADPQSWDLYAYVRNNPLKFSDPTGEDCVYTSSQTEPSVTATVERGSCSRDGGTFVNGTIGVNSFRYNGSSLDVGFINASGSVGVLSKGFAPAPSDALPDDVAAMFHEAGSRAARDTSTLMIASAVFATAYASTYGGPALLAGYAALGETGAVGPGVGS